MTGVLGQHGGTAGHEGVDQRHGWRRTLPRPNTRAPTRLLPRGRVANDTPTRLIIYIVDSVGWDEATVLGPKRNQKTNGRFPEIFQTARAVTDCLSLPRFASVDRQVHNHRYHLTRTRIPPLLSDVPPFENPACAPYNSTRELLLSTGSSSRLRCGTLALTLITVKFQTEATLSGTLGHGRSVHTRPSRGLVNVVRPLVRYRERRNRSGSRREPLRPRARGRLLNVFSARILVPDRRADHHPRPPPNRRRPLLIRA